MINQEVLQELTESYLKNVISEASGSLTPDFNSLAPFGELGINSFHVIKIIKMLEADFGVLSKTLLFEHFTIHELSLFFIKNHLQILTEKFSGKLQNSNSSTSNTKQESKQVDSNVQVTRVPNLDKATIKVVNSNTKNKPILILEKKACCDTVLEPLIQTLFNSYKNETSVSRGTKNIAPYLFIGSEQKGYLNLSRSKNIVLVYAYTGPDGYFDVIANELQQYCYDNTLELNIFSDNPLKSVGKVPFSATPFGVVQRIVNLQEFTLKGGSMRRLRYQISKFEKSGNCHTEEYSCGTNPDIDRNIADIIDSWCESRTMVNPLIYTVKEDILAGTLSQEHRLFLTYSEDVLQNVILISSMSSEQNGYLMDLEFYSKDMPLGGLEYAIVNIISILVAQGCNLLSLGGTYGCKLNPSSNADLDVERVLDELREQNIFNDEGNFQFKNKFRPENSSIHLCRAVTNKNYNNVIDIIMMIAEPSEEEFLDDEGRELTQVSQEDFKVLPTATSDNASVSIVDVNQNLTESVIQGEQRSVVLSDYGFNPLTIPDEHVEFDLKTDSWAQLKMPSIEKQMKHLHSQLQQPVNLDESLRKIFPFAYFSLTKSGRTAEGIFYKAFPKEGTVLQNMLFPTAIFHQIDKGFTPKELVSAEVFNLNSKVLFKGNLDLEALQEYLKDNSADIAFVCIEVSDNASGGYPVSVQHLEKVKALLSKYTISLVLDGTRIVENALFVIEHEQGYAGHTVWQVAQKIFSYADAVIASLAKDFCVNKGGLIATNDIELFDNLQTLINEEGCGLDVIDKKLIAFSIQSKKQIEIQVSRRMQWVKLIWEALKSYDIPVVQPVGGHCLLIDVKQISQFHSFDFPVASFLAWMYLNTGIRAGAHSAGMQQNSSINGLVRLAIPVGLKKEEVESITNKLIELFANKENIPEVIKQDTRAQSLGEIDAVFQLTKYHQPSGNIITKADFLACESEAQTSINLINENEDIISSKSSVTESVDYDKPLAKETATENKSYQSQDVAIIGMAARHPKASNLNEMWENLIQGLDCVDDIPDNRFKGRRQPESAPKYRGGFIEDVDKFDSLFFNISPREAETMDPQERLFLEVAWEAVEDAGYYPETLVPENNTRNIGVFVGAVWTMYQTLGAEERLLGNDVITNSFLWSIANRVSYHMNLSGPSLAVDTACSASLTALNFACEALYKGECSSAIVGGVNLDVHRAKQEMSVGGGALSEDGVCRSFGKGANGYVAGEGVNAVLIKPLKQAIKDGDNIQGVIKSIAVNHGGKTSGYSVPNPKAQTEVILSALDKAKVDARTIGYIEAHGTGTELGDPIEITGLTNAYEKYQVKNQSCSIGSVKTNIGHLEAAAGIASVCKVLLQMKHNQLVPSLHSAELNEFINFADSPFYVQQKLQSWQNKEIDGISYPLRAGISSFGAGGANGHVIIEKYEVDSTSTAENSLRTEEQIFPLSAKNEEQLREMAIRLQTFIRNDLSQEVPALAQDLNNIAYTLQTGRKSFGCRMAIIADNKEQLLERLTFFIDGKKDYNTLSGKVQNVEGITKLLNAQEKKEFIKMVSQGRNIKKLAQLWIDDFLSDWQGTVHAENARRVSLPTYPFADKRYWVGDMTKKSVMDLSSGTKLHPLLDSNESTFQRQIFKKTFTEQEFFIYDHLVSDIPTLPGVAYLDLVRKAGEIAAGRKVQKIKNILWVSPLTVEDSKPTETFVELLPNGETIKFEVFGYKEDGGKQLYSQGSLLYATKIEEEAESEYIDIESIRSRCSKVLVGKDAYPLFKSLGLHLGPSFQVVQDVYKNETEVLGSLSIPDMRSGDFNDFILHPSLVDGSFQAAMGAQLVGDTGGEMVVPYSLGEVEILHPLTPVCFSYVVEAKGNKKAGSGLSKKNVFIVDQDGKILVKVKDSVGVSLTDVHEKPAQSNNSSKSGKANDDDFSKLYYSSVWDESSLTGEVELQQLDNILLFDTNETLANLYRKRLKQAGKNNSHVILVQPGNAYEQTKNGTYKINPQNKADYIELFTALAEKEWSIGKICFAWPAIPLSDKENSYSESVLQESLTTGVYAFLYLCQSIIEQKLESKIQLLYLYLASKNKPQSHNEAINGFANILQAENPKLSCKVLEIQSKASVMNDDVWDAVLSEYHLDNQKSLIVRYDEQGRYVKEIKRFALEETFSADPENSVIKEKGVYFITGGAGGLGLIFAEYLAREYQARLILTGRSVLSTETEAKLDELRNLGAQVIYLQGDISNYKDVKVLMQKSKEEFAGIDGIIHSAGVLRDAYVRNKTFEEMEAVFAPKIKGTLHLDEVSKNEDLDFFVTFSSLAAIAGNAGQSDYSFANHFMDSFAHKREILRSTGERTGKTLSLNWSLWADGGMQLDEQTELFFRNSLGIKPLSKETGLETFIKGLSSNQANFAVIEGVQDKIEHAWGLTKEKAPEASTSLESTGLENNENSTLLTIAPTLDEEMADSELTTLVQNELSKIVIDFLKLDSEDLDTILLDLGFDSIGLTTFANAVNDKYELEITPVLFFEYPNIREIGRYIADEHAENVLKVHGSVGSVNASPTVQQVPAGNDARESSSTENFSINKWQNPDVTAQNAQGTVIEGSFSAEHRFVQQPIAIVGASGVMPQSDDLDEYWQKLRNSENNMVTLIPEDRWSWEEYYGDPLEEENKTKSKWGGFMRDVDKFDPLFWGISPREAEMMDPQQRIFLETVWRAVEDSGHKVSDLAGTKTGLFVGAATRDYIDALSEGNAQLDGYSASGTSHAILANRVSFLLGLHGPSAPLDTACSSSLVALHRAIESIHTGSSEMAIVGGVQVMLTPAAFISFGAAGMLASDGQCKTFDERADGYVRGEGSGAIFIKPLSKAEADGNHIYAVIKATAENHGGRATMLTAPNPNAQADLLVEAYDKAQIDPTTVGYIECHGTGTSLGDPIEVQAMKKAFSVLYKKHNKGKAEVPHVGLTSAKTNIGHLETAAGIAGILKVILSMKNKEIPGLLHFEKINPYINLTGTPFYMVEKTQPWQSIKAADGSELPRRAGISSFGFGGANVHVVLEEYLTIEKQIVVSTQEPHLIVLSAKNENRLKAYAQSMLSHIEKEEIDLTEFAYTLQVGRDAMEQRLGFIVNSVEQLATKLQDYVQVNDQDKQDTPDIYQGRIARKKVDLGVNNSTINEWFEQRNYAEMLDMWVKGLNLDWNNLYGQIKPKRLSLPTYPFARERYWFTANDKELSETKKLSTAVLHPLLHVNTSLLRQQSYCSHFNGDEFFLKTHQLNLFDAEETGVAVQKVMIEMACLEMARESVVQATLSQKDVPAMELRNIIWNEPVLIKENIDVSIALFENDNDQIDYEIYSSEQEAQSNETELLHCQGSVIFNESLVSSKIDIDQVKAQMREGKLVAEDLYSAFEYMGINYGKSLQSITAIYQGENQQLVYLTLPEEMKSSKRDYVLHPSLMESALQSAICLITQRDGIDSLDPVPLSLEVLKITSACTDEMYAWVRYARGSLPGDNKPKLDIDLIDNQGNICITFKSLTFNNENAEKNTTLRSNFEMLLDSLKNENSPANTLNKTENANTVFGKLLDDIIKG